MLVSIQEPNIFLKNHRIQISKKNFKFEDLQFQESNQEIEKYFKNSAFQSSKNYYFREFNS